MFTQSRIPWLLFLITLTAVAAPSICIVWLIRQASESERLAVRQRLADVANGQLDDIRREMESGWLDYFEFAIETLQVNPVSRRFNMLVSAESEGACDSAIILDGMGRFAYPAPLEAYVDEPPLFPADWRDAERAEFGQRDAGAAAQLYKSLAEKAESNSGHSARAFLARARCLLKSGNREEALNILTVELQDERFDQARNESGQLIAPNALLFALQVPRDDEGETAIKVAELAQSGLRDSKMPLLDAAQQLFLMRELRALFPDRPVDPMEEKLALALEWLEQSPTVGEEGKSAKPIEFGFQPSGLPGVFTYYLPDRSVILLYREETLQRRFALALKRIAPTASAEIALLPPEDPGHDPAPFLTIPASGAMPGWRLAYTFEGDDPFGAAAREKTALYWWTGLLGVALTVALGLAAAQVLGRQLRLTRLKNDLIATVSHELKTPLATMRAAVDTLREGRVTEPKQVAEYMDMLAGENARLSRLIDNFLAFSRMERNKQAFDIQSLAPADAAKAAVEALGNRFDAPNCQLTVEIDEKLPNIRGDRDALVGALINLLDNAWKYTGAEKRFVLRVGREDNAVVFAVEDNGVGMTKRQIRRAFERFYQADRSLSRGAGGCGLGLSIVRYIVAAHGGTVDVKSRPGEGSVFTIRIPAIS